MARGQNEVPTTYMFLKESVYIVAEDDAAMALHIIQQPVAVLDQIIFRCA